MAARKPVGLRGLLSQVSEEDATLESIRGIVSDALGAESTTLVDCPHCQKSFKAKQPDVKKQLDAVIALLEQIEGRPEQRSSEVTSITIVRPPL